MLDRGKAKLHVGRVLEGNNTSTFEIDPESLTKHTIILGATGSGKTVLSKVIVEEAALMGVPVLAIDPKGDIGNLAFKSATFDFSGWSDKEADALKIERSAYSKGLQKTYREKMQEFEVSESKVSDFANKVLVRIFTPKSSAGLAVGIAPDLSAPKDFGHLLKIDAASAADLLDLTSYNLLRLAGFGEDDRKEITFVSTILENAWKNGEDMTIKDLIRNIENPPFPSVGSLPVSKVMPDKERRALATKINLLISDPKMRSWSSTESINFSELFGKEKDSNGAVPINIVDLRNIQSEQEKHVFVELILQRMFQWLIKQGSAQTLRYMLYFDEIAGYCPPIKEPASKKLLLLLIKQARAFGLGILLASQNAVDLDYKVISNANIRFIGRLGAKRDIQRVSTGLELGSDSEEDIARLRSGEFLCNIFDPKFKSIIKVRWPLTYHRGPLEDSEIAELMSGSKKSRKEDDDYGTNMDNNSGKETKELEEEKSEVAPTTAVQAEKAAPNIDTSVRQENSGMQEQSVSATTDGADVHHALVPLHEDDDVFLMLNKRYEPKNLAQFIKLGSNLKSLKVLEEKAEEVLYPIFELDASVFEKKYAKQSLVKTVELAAFNGLTSMPDDHSVTSSRVIMSELRKESEHWKGKILQQLSEMKKELANKFDILMEEKRTENVEMRSLVFLSKISHIDETTLHLQEVINRSINSVEKYNDIYNELKKEAKDGQRARKIKKGKKNGKNTAAATSSTVKSRLISVENKIEVLEQKILSTRRKIEQLHANRNAMQEKLRQIEEDENEKFHVAMDNIGSKEGFRISGWLIEIVYRARVLINDGKEHYGDVKWSSYTGLGTWGRCSSCSVALDEGYACSCGNLLCSTHLAYCKICLEPACEDHRSLCYICHSIFCAAHSIRCEICRSNACSEHSGICSICNRKVCARCSQKKFAGFLKRELVCAGCSSNNLANTR